MRKLGTPTAVRAIGGSSNLLWFAGFLLLAIVFVSGDTVSRFTFLRAINGVATSDLQPGAVPVSAGATERWTVLPANAIDTRWWVIYAEQAMREGTWRVRETRVDNFPEGREVHWSSGTVWLLDAIARIRGSIGRPAIDEVPYATFWAGLAMLGLVWGMLTILVGRRYGLGLAGFQILLVTTCFPFYEVFRAGETDHHGLVLLFAVGSVLSLAAGGSGLTVAGHPIRKGAEPINPTALLPLKSAEGWFALAGLLGAAAMWVSAASMIPVLTGCAAGSLAAVWSARLGNSGIQASPELWRVWGRWGCGGCLFFYALEYFPSHLGWRLEVNHPVYALAWLAGGEILFRLCRKSMGGTLMARDAGDRLLLGLSVSALLLPALLILVWPQAVFLVRDPFLLSLLTQYVRELQPVWTTIQGPDAFANAIDYFLWPVLAVAGFMVLLRKKLSPAWRSVLVFAFGVALVIQLQALAQVRWSGLALGLWSICILLLLAAYLARAFTTPIPRGIPYVFGALALVGFVAYPQLSFRTLWADRYVQQHLPQSVVPTFLLRDIAHRLIQGSPQKVPVVLTDPTSATELAYFGGIRTFGTLYWENTGGLRKTSGMFAAPAEAELRKLLDEARVTHLVIPSWDGLSTGEAHRALLEKSGLLTTGTFEPYLDRVLKGSERPLWLRPFHYPIPAAFGLHGAVVRIFQFCPEQTPFEAHFHYGVFEAQTGGFAAAEDHFRKALALNPKHSGASEWLRKISETTQRDPLSAGNELIK